MAVSSPLSPIHLIALFWSLEVIEWTLFCLRFHVVCKRRKTRSTRFSDLALLAALVVLTASASATTWTLVKQQHYRHSTQPDIIPQFGVPIDTARIFLKVGFGQDLAYLTCLWLIKSVFLGYYFSLRRYLSHRFRITMYALAVLVAVLYVINMVLRFAWCAPLSSVWSLDKTQCTPSFVPFVLYFASWSNIISDLLLMVFPVVFLRTLKLCRSQMWAFGILLIIGGMTVMVAIARFIVILRLKQATDPAEFYVFWEDQVLVAGLEQAIGFICACLPALRVFLNDNRESIRRRVAGAGGATRSPMRTRNGSAGWFGSQKSAARASTAWVSNSETELREIGDGIMPR